MATSGRKVWVARLMAALLLIAVVFFSYLAIFRSSAPPLGSSVALADADQSIAIAAQALASASAPNRNGSDGADSQEIFYLENVLTYLISAREKLRNDYNELTNKRSELSSEMFQIMVSLFAIFGIFLTLAVGAVSWIIKSEILDSVDEEIDSQLRDRIEYGTLYAQAVTYGQFAFTWWELYEDSYQEGSKDCEASGDGSGAERDREKRLLEHARNALSMAQRGLDCCAASAFVQRINEKTDGSAWRQEAGLLNHWVYHRTIELDLDEFRRDPVESLELRELTSRAKDLICRAEDDRAQGLGGFWYNAYETAGFALAMHGNEEELTQGKKILKGLITGQLRPGMKFDLPPREWRQSILSEHNQRFDLRIDLTAI